MSYLLPREGHRSAPEGKRSCCGEAPLIPSNDNSHNSAKVNRENVAHEKKKSKFQMEWGVSGDSGVAVGAARTVPVSLQAKGETPLRIKNINQVLWALSDLLELSHQQFFYLLICLIEYHLVLSKSSLSPLPAIFPWLLAKYLHNLRAGQQGGNNRKRRSNPGYKLPKKNPV